MDELDRVLRCREGSLILIGGDRELATTLLLQVCYVLSHDMERWLYVSGEESVRQIKMRADRWVLSDELYLVSETNVDIIMSHVQNLSLYFGH